MFPNASKFFTYCWYVFGVGMFYYAITGHTFNPNHYIAFSWIVWFGIVLAVKTAKENYGHNCALYHFVEKCGKRWTDWYDGGNATYDPSMPWTQDFWHWLRDWQTYSVTFALVFSTGMPIYILFPFIENAIFTTKSTWLKDGTFNVWSILTESFNAKNKFK